MKYLIKVYPSASTERIALYRISRFKKIYVPTKIRDDIGEKFLRKHLTLLQSNEGTWEDANLKFYLAIRGSVKWVVNSIERLYGKDIPPHARRFLLHIPRARLDDPDYIECLERL